MKPILFTQIEGDSGGYWMLLGWLAVFAAAALGATWYMEHNGHWVTGMSNQVVWGTPHVFAVFLIVAASGALNVASISSVFGRVMYKPLARLSTLLSLALLAGGLILLFTIPVNVVMAQELVPSQTGTVSALMMGFAWGLAGLVFVPAAGWAGDVFSLHVVLFSLLVFPLIGLLPTRLLPD